MKNKKRVLTVLLILIVIIASFLALVLLYGGKKDKELNAYYETLEKATCQLVKDENYTKEICEAYSYLCKVHLDKLVNKEYINSNLTNPLTGKKASDDTKSYVEVTWKDKAECKYKEG